MLRLPSSAIVIGNPAVKNQTGQSFVPVLNTVAGVRMEERSPGSYRLSIRGSLLRSPFGIRNIKVYLDEFPLTNGGGETYFNLLDVNCVHSLEVLKGPDGSLFGANSGGVLRINTFNSKSDTTIATIGLQGGSYGLSGDNISVRHLTTKNIFSFKQAWLHCNGYRENSAINRNYFQLANHFNYGRGSQLRFFSFYSDLNYKTPGGLTFLQYNENPGMARPATNIFPGAIDQKAGILNKTVFAGLTNDLKILDRIRNVTSVFGSGTRFENPFITNYEIRNEMNGGARTWLELKNKSEEIKLTFNIGGELQYFKSKIFNYDNNLGVKGVLRIEDYADIIQTFGFVRLITDYYNKLIFETSLSYNYNQFSFFRQYPFSSVHNNKTLQPALMPKFALSLLVSGNMALRFLISKGYSPPTVQEIRSSTNEINLSLQAEKGWNYETGLRFVISDGKLIWDVCAFHYQLSDAIVRRLNAAGQEYFMNAGNTFQEGIESQLTINVIRRRNVKFIRAFRITNAYTLSYFKFGNYQTGNNTISGNDLTGVPRNVSLTGITVSFPFNLYFFAQYNFTDRIPLTDSNSDYADSYNLVLVKAGWGFILKKLIVDFSTGVDNLLNEKYSLGNDLNAAGGRYYNAAPLRNYFFRAVINI